MEEIYKDLSSPKSKEFEKLLNTEFSKSQISEGKIADGTITKITNKLIFLELPGAKSEGTLDINEMKLLKEEGNLKVGSKISVLVVKLEDKKGDLIISREKAKKIKSWKQLEKAFENNEEVQGRIISKIKGGFVVDIQSSMCFLPGSQVDLKPQKNINHLMKEPLKFMIVKCDKIRGNIVVSRRAVLENIMKTSKEEVLSKFDEGDIVEGTVKGITDYGVFFDLNGIDCMTHINECSWSRIGHPEELFTIGQKQKLKIIKIDTENKKISTSVKMLTPDPFNTKINNYKVGKIYPAEVRKITDYGVFLSLEEGLEGLCHQSELAHVKKNISAKKLLSLSQKIEVMIMEIDVKKRRISLSYKNTQPNPWKKFEKEFPVGSKVEGTIKNITEFALFININDFDLDGMIYYKDISYEESVEELGKYKKNDPITAKVLEHNQEKIRLGLKQLLPDPIDYFKDKKKKDIITVIVLETLDNGIKVKPDGCPMKILIKKNQIAINKEDQRTNRFNKGDKVDCMLLDLDLKKRKVSLSIKILEEEQTKEAIKRYGSVDSGRSLPFAELPKTLKKKNKTKEK
ncbi:MAG: S1 RNA-binding domain-containing protein [Pelagibacteraceae bacterium]|nr:S1 RNA-binding domain-containing protein [Pelagibacteraceae bacterium]